MARVQCKGCDYEPSEHDTLVGYCMICAARMVRGYEQQTERIRELEARSQSQAKHIELLKQCDDSSIEVIGKMDAEIEQKDKRIEELEAWGSR